MLICTQLVFANYLQTMRFVSSRTVRFREIAHRASGDCARPRNITSMLLDYADIYDTLFYTLLSPIFSNRITNAAVGTRRRLCSFSDAPTPEMQLGSDFHPQAWMEVGAFLLRFNFVFFPAGIAGQNRNLVHHRGGMKGKSCVVAVEFSWRGSALSPESF